MEKEKPIWKIKGSSEELPQDIQDALNKASETYTNEEGVTLLEVMQGAINIAENFVIKEEGYFRKAPDKCEQLSILFNDRYVYCEKENFISWLEYEKKEIPDYDNIDKDSYGMIPLCICGIKGNEFDRFTGKNKIEISSNLIILIDGEEQDILLGKLKGDGSNILYS